jgi:hypothetical protein
MKNLEIIQIILDAGAGIAVYLLVFSATGSYILSTCASAGAVAYGVVNWFIGSASR